MQNPLDTEGRPSATSERQFLTVQPSVLKVDLSSTDYDTSSLSQLVMSDSNISQELALAVLKSLADRREINLDTMDMVHKPNLLLVTLTLRLYPH
jgi:hypothetical protein